jgi:hypothetical protein
MLGALEGHMDGMVGRYTIHTCACIHPDMHACTCVDMQNLAYMHTYACMYA